MKKNGIELTFETDEKLNEYNMERCANFVARMILKYGKQVLKEIDAEKKEKGEEESETWEE